MPLDSSQLNFIVLTDEFTGKPSGRFIPPSTKLWRQCEEKLDTAIEKASTYGKFFSVLDGILKKEPFFLDAYAHAGGALLEIDEIAEAYEYYERGIDKALALIPRTFKGDISWYDLDNRPFLRLYHGYILSLMHQKKYDEAARHMEKQLKWNHNDNMGIRYLVGDAYLLAGKVDKARRALTKGVFSRGSVPYPPSAYTLGLLEFREGNYVAAARALRVGFATNMYIAEILTGRVVEKPHFFWHGTSDASVKAAKGYLSLWGIEKIWQLTPQAIDFLDWFYNCSTVMRDRLELAEIKDGLTYEHDPIRRIPFCVRRERLMEDISKKEVPIHKVIGRSGEQRWPWEHSRVDLLLEE